VAIFRTRRRSVEAVTNGTRGAEGETELAVASGQTFVAPGEIIFAVEFAGASE